MGLLKRIKKYVAPSHKTLANSYQSVGNNLESAGKQIATSITDPSSEQGKKILSQVGGFVAGSLGDPYAGKGISNALNDKPVTQGVGGPVGLGSRALAADRAAAAGAQQAPLSPYQNPRFRVPVQMAPVSRIAKWGSRAQAADQMLGEQV